MSIGSQLKQARQAKGISLKEASGKTKIPDRFLEAIENDNIHALPNPVYAKWFIKNYARFLGLDVNSVTENLRQESGIKKVEQFINLPAEKLPAVDSERYFKKALLVVCFVPVFIGAAVLLINTGKGVLRHKITAVGAPQQKKRAIVKPKRKPPVVIQRAVKPAQPALVAPSAVAARPFQEASLNLSITSKKPCHVSVKADGRLFFDDFLLAGSTEEWQAKTKFELGLSDCSVVELTLNGRRLNLFYKGAKSGILITKDGIRRM